MLDPLVDAFMSVGVIVAGIMLVIGGMQMLWGDRFEAALSRSRRAGPMIGALLSFPPGCVGVLTAARLYGKGRASYGTAVAALTATMGDSAWLLLAVNPVLTLKLKALLCVLGCIFGYVIDALAIDPVSVRSVAPIGVTDARASWRTRAVSCHGGAGHDTGGGRAMAALRARLPRQLQEQPPIPVFPPRTARAAVLSFGLQEVHLLVLFWALAILGLFVSIPVYFQFADPEQLARTFGQVDFYSLIGVTGFLTSVCVFVVSPNKLCCAETTHNCRPTLREVLESTSREVAFVTVWCGLAFLAWETVAAILHIDPSHIRLGGAAAVIVGALGGLIPACGVEILFASLFISGAIPLSGLIAYLVSEDGAGLIPLAALKPRSAVLASALTTLPGLALGFIALWLGF